MFTFKKKKKLNTVKIDLLDFFYFGLQQKLYIYIYRV